MTKTMMTLLVSGVCVLWLSDDGSSQLIGNGVQVSQADARAQPVQPTPKREGDRGRPDPTIGNHPYAVAPSQPFVIFAGTTMTTPLLILHVGVTPPDGSPPLFLPLGDITRAPGLEIFFQTRTKAANSLVGNRGDGGVIIYCPKAPLPDAFADQVSLPDTGLMLGISDQVRVMTPKSDTQQGGQAGPVKL